MNNGINDTDAYDPSPQIPTRIVTIQPRNLLALELLAHARRTCVAVKPVVNGLMIEPEPDNLRQMLAAADLAKNAYAIHNMLEHHIAWRDIVGAAEHLYKAMMN